MSRGRPVGPKKDDIHVSVDEDIALYWRVRFHDTFTGKMQKSKLSELVTRLLRQERDRELQAATTKGEQHANN